MLFSLALIFIFGIIIGGILQKLKLPSLLGMLIVGIVLGPSVLNLLDPKLLEISGELREIALIIILMRAGLALNVSDLIKAGRPAILMCFVPACFEIVGMIVIAPALLGITVLEAAILGAVIAAVSPAVIVPKMLKLMNEKYGTDKSIPQMILAGASIDDIFVIVFFTVFIGMEQGEAVSAMSFINIPISVVLGLLAGVLAGIVLNFLFGKIHVRDSVKVILMLGVSFVLVVTEDVLAGIVGFSGLLAVMSMGAALQKTNTLLSSRLSVKFSKLWVAAEVILFVLVGATVDVKYALSAGVSVVVVILVALIFRMVGVLACMIKTNLNFKEKAFCMIAYTPKATVQAAIGSIPLALGLPCGKIILTVAVVAILITAPTGAFAIDATYKKLLNRVQNSK